MQIEFSSQQQTVIDKAVKWFTHGKTQVFKLWGYAGSGKTTLIKPIIDRLDLDTEAVRYAAPTGKAAYVMRLKGNTDCETIHKLIYTPIDQLKALVKKLETAIALTDDPDERDRLNKELDDAIKAAGSPEFMLNQESRLACSRLLVLDESSMVGDTIARDLKSFGVKILAIGDPAQLPPISGGQYFMKGKPHGMLSEIHRSALDSPVTRLSMAVREADRAGGPKTLGVDGMDGDSGRTESVSFDDLMSADQVLVGTNRTRWDLVRRIRQARDLPLTRPVVGDRMMILANNYNHAIVNGQQLTIHGVSDGDKAGRLAITGVDDSDPSGREITMQVWESGFVDQKGQKRAEAKSRDDDVSATWSEAVTVHKAQGSQWRNVLVVDESSAFWGPAYHADKDTIGTQEAWRRAADAARPWLYTAVTRASDRVLITSTSGLPDRGQA